MGEEGYQKSQKMPRVLECEELLEVLVDLFLEDLFVDGLKMIFYHDIFSEVDTWSSVACICPKITI